MPTCPLDVHTVLVSDLQAVGDEVVLNGGIRLHDVAPLPSHVQVVQDAAPILLIQRATWAEHDSVRPVLEGAAKLGSVDGQAERLVVGQTDVHVGVLLDGRASTSGTEEKENMKIY